MSRYVVKAHEDVVHEPDFPGDEAIIGPAFWEVWCDVEKRPGGFVGVWIDNFDTEEQAQAAADEWSAEDAAAQPLSPGARRRSGAMTN